MKIRSITELSDFLDSDVAWRKHELLTSKLLVASARSHQRSMLARSGTCLAYAHWDGFVKSAARAYLNFIAVQGLHYCDLATNFVAVGLRARLKAAEASKGIVLYTEVSEFLLSDLRQPADIPWSEAVRTDNLDSAAFRDVTVLLGLDYLPYAPKGLFIDGQLLRLRHPIAHGERIEVDASTHAALHDQTLELIEAFRIDVQNAAATGRFRRSRGGGAPSGTSHE